MERMKEANSAQVQEVPLLQIVILIQKNETGHQVLMQATGEKQQDLDFIQCRLEDMVDQVKASRRNVVDSKGSRLALPSGTIPNMRG